MDLEAYDDRKPSDLFFGLPSLAVCAFRITIGDGTAIYLRFDPSNQPESFLNEFLEYLQRQRESITRNVLTVLPIILEHEGNMLEQLLDQRVRELKFLEGEIGMTSWSTAQPNQNQARYELLTKELHQCRCHGINLDYLQGIELMFGQYCKTMFEVLEDLKARRGMECSTVADRDAFVQLLDYHTSRSRLRAHAISQLERRTQTQINVVSRDRFLCRLLPSVLFFYPVYT